LKKHIFGISYIVNLGTLVLVKPYQNIYNQAFLLIYPVKKSLQELLVQVEHMSHVKVLLLLIVVAFLFVTFSGVIFGILRLGKRLILAAARALRQ
jgi:hypothetical protein